jgi:hypothetical protein
LPFFIFKHYRRCGCPHFLLSLSIA